MHKSFQNHLQVSNIQAFQIRHDYWKNFKIHHIEGGVTEISLVLVREKEILVLGSVHVVEDKDNEFGVKRTIILSMTL